MLRLNQPEPGCTCWTCWTCWTWRTRWTCWTSGTCWTWAGLGEPAEPGDPLNLCWTWAGHLTPAPSSSD